MVAIYAVSMAVAALRQFFIMILSPDDGERESIVGFFFAMINCGYHVSAVNCG
jgi:hypothetical protein